MPSRRLIKDPERYKTVMCATWCRSGECPYGRKCQFAHGKEELRTRTAPMVASAPSMAPPGPSSMGGPYNMGSSVQQLPQPPQPTGWSMPPLPPGPPPPMHAGATSAAPILGSNVGAALQHQQLGSLPSMPPLPPGPPPPTATPPRPSYDQAAVNSAFVSSSSQQTRAGMSADCSPASLSPPMPSVSVNGPLDCPGALIGASVLTPSVATQTPAKLPAALLNTGANSNEQSATGHGHPLLTGSNQGMGIIGGNSAVARPWHTPCRPIRSLSRLRQCRRCRRCRRGRRRRSRWRLPPLLRRSRHRMSWLCLRWISI